MSRLAKCLCLVLLPVVGAAAPTVHATESTFERDFATWSANHGDAMAAAKEPAERAALSRAWWAVVQRAVSYCHVQDSFRFWRSDIAWRWREESPPAPLAPHVVEGDCTSDLTPDPDSCVHILGDLKANIVLTGRSELVIGGSVDPTATIRLKGDSSAFIAGEMNGLVEGGGSLWVGGDLIGHVKDRCGIVNVWGRCLDRPDCYRLVVHSEYSRDDVARILKEDDVPSLTWVRSSRATVGVYSSTKHSGVVAILTGSSGAARNEGQEQGRDGAPGVASTPDAQLFESTGIADQKWNQLVVRALRLALPASCCAYFRLRDELCDVPAAHANIHKIEADLDGAGVLPQARILYLTGRCGGHFTVPDGVTLFVSGNVDGTLELKGHAECVVGGSISKKARIVIDDNADFYVGGSVEGVIEAKKSLTMWLDGDLNGELHTGSGSSYVRVCGALTGLMQPTDPEQGGSMHLIVDGHTSSRRIREIAKEYAGLQASFLRSDVPAGFYPAPFPDPEMKYQRWVVLEEPKEKVPNAEPKKE